MNCIKYFTMENNSCMLNYLEVKYSQLNLDDVMDIIIIIFIYFYCLFIFDIFIIIY